MADSHIQIRGLGCRPGAFHAACGRRRASQQTSSRGAPTGLARAIESWS